MVDRVSMETSQKIGKVIKDIRLKKGLSQKTLGEMMGISPALLSKYELGDLRQPFEVMVKFSKVLDTDILVFCEVVSGTKKEN